MFYSIFRIFAGLGLKIYFRKIHFTGSEKIPEDKPILLVSNHVNGLIDPLFMITHLKRQVHVTAKNVLTKNPLFKYLFCKLNVIEFHRSQDIDKGADARENVKSIRRCVKALSGGESLCIFPEGFSHSETRMAEFKPGAAKIAMDFLKKIKNDLTIVPVGLNFMDKEKFRSDVWVRFGTPFSLKEWKEKNPESGLNDLTKELTERIEGITQNFDNRRELWGLRWAAELLSTGADSPASLDRFDSSIIDHFELVEKLHNAYLRGSKTMMDDILDMAEEVQVYQRQLRRLGIIPAEIFLPLNPAQAAFFILREIEILVIGMPMAVIGWLLFITPYLITRAIAVKYSKSRDHWASFAIYSGAFVFPVICGLELLMLLWLLPFYLWLMVIICLPFLGYYLLNYLHRTGGAIRRARTFLILTFLPNLRRKLVARGKEIIRKMQILYRAIEREV